MIHLGDSLDFYQAVYNFVANVGQFYYHPVFLLTPYGAGAGGNGAGVVLVQPVGWCPVAGRRRGSFSDSGWI